MSTTTLVVGAILTLFGGGTMGAIGAAIVTAVSNRRKNRADVTETITDAASDLVAMLRTDAAAARADAAAARADAAGARREAAETHVQMTAIRREAEALADKLHRLVEAINSPGITVETLRMLAPMPPGQNGTGGY